MDALKRMAFDSCGDPHADSASSATMSWQQIGDPDVSADSFQKAGDQMGQTWQRMSTSCSARPGRWCAVSTRRPRSRFSAGSTGVTSVAPKRSDGIQTA
jgi:hypothetical protein